MKETEKQAVERFANAMYEKLVFRRGRYKNFGWRDPKYRTIGELQEHLLSEVEEAMAAPEDISELVDISNCAFMIYDRITNEKQSKSCPSKKS